MIEPLRPRVKANCCWGSNRDFSALLLSRDCLCLDPTLASAGHSILVEESSCDSIAADRGSRLYRLFDHGGLYSKNNILRAPAGFLVSFEQE